MTRLTALELLKESGETVDMFSHWFLSAISVLDEHGAWTWNLLHVGMVTFLALGSVRITMGHWHGVDWYAFLHAIVSTLGSFVALFLDYSASEKLTGMQEPLRSVLCHGPLTSLHRILPAITMGYSIFDIIDGLALSPDFLFHGCITFIVMAVFVHVDAPHMIAPFLFMELSTPFLNLMRADFLSPDAAVINQACFTLGFFISRLVVVPRFWADLVYHMWQNRTEPDFTNCYPGWLLPFTFVFGMFFNILNVYWFRKIVRKAIRRIKGIEKHTEKNELSSESNPSRENARPKEQ